MNIRWIEFENLETGLKIERVEFNRDLTLLVGVSGAGKTQILNAVRFSLELAVSKEDSLLPYHCKLGIEIDSEEYEWEYIINRNENKEILAVDKEEYCFGKESLKKGKEELFLRENEKVCITGYDKVPTPKKNESLLAQYAEDEVFKKIVQEIDKLYSIETDIDVRVGTGSKGFNELLEYVTFLSKMEEIDKETLSPLPVVDKLYLYKKYLNDIYAPILDRVQDIFPEIEDIDVIEDELRKQYVIAIQVYGKQLMQHQISNGMLKSIYYIVELYTMAERKDLQFIITSHHPKIINGIEPSKWKIIDREVSVIKNYNSEQYGIGNSKHEPYFNLVNRLAFEGKI